MSKAQVKKVFVIIMEIALAIAISLVIFLRITTVKQSTANEEFFIATDLARLIEAVQASSGTTFYSYTHEQFALSPFSFDFPRTGMTAAVQSKNVIVPWHADMTLQYNAEPTAGAERIEIARYADKLNIGAPSTTANLKERACNKGSIKSTVIIDPAFGGKQAGKTTGDRQEKDVTRAIARQLSSSKKFNFSTTRSVDIDEEKNMHTRADMAKDAAAIITLTVGDTIDARLNENTVIAYIPYNSKESNDLACNILNSLAQLASITGTAIVPIDAQLISKDDSTTQLEDEADPRSLVHLGKPAVALAIGNPSQPFNTVQLGDAILAGLVSYSP